MRRAYNDADNLVRRDDDDDDNDNKLGGNINVANHDKDSMLYRIIALTIYYVLVLTHAFVRLWHSVRNALTSTLWLMKRKQNAPPHVAFVGYLDNHPAHVARLVKTVADAGTKTVSICANDAPAIEKAVAQAGLVRIHLCVLPPSPRRPLVNAAKQIVDKQLRDVSTVVEEIDEWHRKNQLPSEPDVVLVLPKNNNETIPKNIASFSVWQLRLTQFRFTRTPVHRISSRTILRLVCSATNAPKRFGR